MIMTTMMMMIMKTLSLRYTLHKILSIAMVIFIKKQISHKKLLVDTLRLWCF